MVAQDSQIDVADRGLFVALVHLPNACEGAYLIGGRGGANGPLAQGTFHVGEPHIDLVRILREIIAVRRPRHIDKRSPDGPSVASSISCHFLTAGSSLAFSPWELRHVDEPSRRSSHGKRE